MKPQDAMAGAGDLLGACFRAGAASGFAPGSILVSAGETPRMVYRLRTGLAYRLHQFRDGRRAIVELLVPGDVVGLEGLLARPRDAVVAAGATRCWGVPIEAFRPMMENPNLVMEVAGSFLAGRWRAEALAARIGRLDAPERLAAVLVDLHDRMLRRDRIARNTFNLPLTQQQIGDHIGLSGVHVNRVLRWLAREHIAFIERHVVIIRDMARLRALGRGDHRRKACQNNSHHQPAAMAAS